MAIQSELFSLIKIPSEKKRIFKEMVHSESEIVLKGKGDTLYFLKPVRISENRWIVCKEVTDLGLQDEDEAIANFSLGSERYFFQTPVQVSSLSVMLEAEVDLYHLQRRKSLRVSVPRDIGAVASIINFKHISTMLEAQVVDFSKGGLRVSYAAPLPEFKSGDPITLNVRLGEFRRPFTVEGIIRHRAEGPANTQVFGIQFVNVSHTLEMKLLTLQMDLQSEIFRKWKLAASH
jgi:hypothetical protein